MKKLTPLLLICLTLFMQKGSAQNWRVTGNNTNANDYLGTNNNMPLPFYTNGHQQMVILQNGNVGIGTNNPTALLQVNGNAIVNGNVYATNLLASNNIAVGTFKIVNGAIIDSAISNAGTLQLISPNVATSGAFTAGTTGPSIIRIDGNAGTITSPSGVISFANNNINTTGAVNMGNLQSSGAVTMAGVATSDTRPDLMQIDNTGRVSALSNSALYSLLYPSGNPYQDPCTGAPCPQWLFNCVPNGTSNIITNSQCDWVGIDVLNAPAAPLDVNGNSLFRGQLIINPLYPNNGGNGNVNQLEVHGGSMSIYNSGDNNSLFFGQDHITNKTFGEWGIQYAPGATYNNNVGGLNFWKPFVSGHFGNNFLWLSDNGNIGIGTAIPGYPLDVNGIVRANEVKVCLFGTCDFVFDKGYKLMSLDSLNNYLDKNHHLPEIASAQQMKDEGNVSLGEMDSKLLQKVEELTLYTIQLQKKSEEQDARIKELEAKLNK